MFRHTIPVCRYFLILLCLTLIESATSQPTLIGRLYPDSTSGSRYGTLPLGDQNGDGMDDIMVNSGSDLFLRILPGGQTVSPWPIFKFKGWSTQSCDIGDINGDGAVDFAESRGSSDLSQLWVYFGGPLLDSFPDYRLGSDSLPGFMVRHHSRQGGDLNMNGTNEIVAVRYLWQGDDRYQDGVSIFELTDPPDSVPDIVFGRRNLSVSLQGMGNGLEVADFDGDGFSDIAVNALPSTDSADASVILYLGGPAWDTLPDIRFYHPDPASTSRGVFGWGILRAPGDLNGDGYEDLVIGSGQVTATYVYYGGPTIDTIPDMVLTREISVAAGAGDVNDDGYADLLVSFPNSGPTGHVLLYYGGPDFDSVPDFVLGAADFRPDTRDWGREIVGLGDYNGDGIDDFSVSVNNFFFTYLEIYSGFHEIATAIPENDLKVPDQQYLNQNYPNPFNPSTTISFDLQAATQVRLEILNLLGQRTRILVNRRLPAGHHEYVWDGNTESGTPASSGPYFYRLLSDDLNLSRKMVLMK